jgi:hypothetical protein
MLGNFRATAAQLVQGRARLNPGQGVEQIHSVPGRLCRQISGSWRSDNMVHTIGPFFMHHK